MSLFFKHICEYCMFAFKNVLRAADICVDLYKHDEDTKGITKKSGQCHGCNGFGLVCYFVCLFVPPYLSVPALRGVSLYIPWWILTCVQWTWLWSASWPAGGMQRWRRGWRGRWRTVSGPRSGRFSLLQRNIITNCLSRYKAYTQRNPHTKRH